ncbi:hypothetical protein MBLNU230_g2762t1 [Neophaeotheca triangularis]
MDTGHYNCRDYDISPHFSPTTITNSARFRPPLNHRHESWDELEQRSRSPASFKPRFPLFKLPLELRQEILSYLLPRTRELNDTNPLASHARNFSAVQKRGEKGMMVPKADDNATAPNSNSRKPNNIVWQRGNVSVFGVCQQLHDECAELVYGSNTFLLFVTYAAITFRFRWLLPSGLAPSRSYDFLELLPERYMRLIKKVVVHVDHVDSYTGMIKFNVSGRGLTQGLKQQVQRLVNVLKPGDGGARDDDTGGKNDGFDTETRILSRVAIRVSNGNAILDDIKREASWQKGSVAKVAEDLEEMLEPFDQLRGVREASVNGSVTGLFAEQLASRMQSDEPPGTVDSMLLLKPKPLNDEPPRV